MKVLVIFVVVLVSGLLGCWYWPSFIARRKIRQLQKIIAPKVEANSVFARQHLCSTRLESLAPAGAPHRIAEGPEARPVTQKGLVRRGITGKGVNSLDGFGDVLWDRQSHRMVVRLDPPEDLACRHLHTGNTPLAEIRSCARQGSGEEQQLQREHKDKDIHRGPPSALTSRQARMSAAKCRAPRRPSGRFFDSFPLCACSPVLHHCSLKLPAGVRGFHWRASVSTLVNPSIAGL